MIIDLILTCYPRQSGKTTTAPGYLLWYAMFAIRRTNTNCSTQIYRRTGNYCNVLDTVMNFVHDYIRAGVVNYNKGSMEFENGSRIVSATTTGNTGRGMSASYYIVMSLHL